MELKAPVNITISARVFRAKKKPRLIPKRIWKWVVKKQLPGTGKWEDKGVLFEGK